MWPQNNWEWLSFAWILTSLGIFAWGYWYTHRRKRPTDSAQPQRR
jgi:predicted negative regulator of RcsB-dependent stress response